jgi:hypothetical protein
VNGYLLIILYSRVIMGLTSLETQPVIHFHRLRGSFIFIKKKIKTVGFSVFFI